MGVPPVMINVLRDWSSKRVTTMTRDGIGSEPWRMCMGVGQGDVLSPLLFNLFIESLGRHISSLKDFAGVTVGDGATSFTVRELKYADDICNPAESPQELQLVLNATVQFILPRYLPDKLPVLTVKGIRVEWAFEYRYFGYNLRRDLSESGNVDEMSANLSAQWQRYFHSSKLVRLHSPALVLQLFKTVVWDLLIIFLRSLILLKLLLVPLMLLL